MPYISKSRRLEIDLLKTELESPGELNYVLTSACKKYLDKHGSSYQIYNDIIGALECCKQELYARLIVGYEALKERQNGDVYDTNASSTNVAWAGGFFEGEGCFYAHYHKPRDNGSKVFRVHASVSQKHEGLLNQFKNVVKCGTVYSDGQNGMFVWKTSKIGDATKVFNLLRPYLGERRQNKYLDLINQEEKQIFRPRKPKRLECSLGHILSDVGVRNDGTCSECSRNYQRNWYHINKGETNG